MSNKENGAGITRTGKAALLAAFADSVNNQRWHVAQ